jgi:hypothetical protein
MDAVALPGAKFIMSVTPAVTESNCSGDSSTLANAGVARPKHMVAAASKFRTVSSPMLVASAISESSGDVHLHWLNPQVVTFGTARGGGSGYQSRMTMLAPNRYAGHRFPPEIISHAVWLNFRLLLTLCAILSESVSDLVHTVARSETFKLSTDPLFVEKVRDIVGLYLDPPDRALVLCVDEKSQSEPPRVCRRQVCLSSTRPSGLPQAERSRRLPPRPAGCCRSVRGDGGC